MQLDRPIFIVGHARGGSTLLAGIINWHSHVGPRCDALQAAPDCNTFLCNILDPQKHINYSGGIEQKNIWFHAFPGEDIFLHMGRELIVETLPPDLDREHLLAELTRDFHQARFMSKAPTNSFRIKAIRQLCHDARIVGICRRGAPVIASWGRRHYGFGKPVNWGQLRIKKMGYIRGITIFARKWYETLSYLHRMHKAKAVALYTYAELTQRPQETSQRILRECELPFEPYVSELSIRPSHNDWKNDIPAKYHILLRMLTARGNRIIGAIESRNSLLPRP